MNVLRAAPPLVNFSAVIRSSQKCRSLVALRQGQRSCTHVLR